MNIGARSPESALVICRVSALLLYPGHQLSCSICMKKEKTRVSPHTEESGTVISVVAAAILQSGKYLCAKRGEQKSLSGLWEFPGGKVEYGESDDEALIREIHEELHCTIEVLNKISVVIHSYESRTIKLSTYLCRLVSGSPQRTEHEELRWVTSADLQSLKWAPADLSAVHVLASEVVLERRSL